MSVWIDRLREVHRFLSSQGVYAVVLSTALAVALFCGRVYIIDRLQNGQPIIPSGGLPPYATKVETPLEVGLGGFNILVNAWQDEYERYFVRGFIGFPLPSAMQLYWHGVENLGRFGALKVLLSALQNGPRRSLVRFLAELSLGYTLTYIFLIWNLFLAWIPYLCSLWAARTHRRYPRRWLLLIIPGVMWFAFFPNAPYILTDLMHLRARAPIPIWYDVVMIVVFAWTGLFLAIYSLRTMHIVVRDYVGSFVAGLFVFGILGLSGLGIYVGRFLRWNSWDLLLHPRSVLANVASHMVNPWSYPQAWGVTLLFATFLLICYVTFATAPTHEEV
jgi:uncharacterized membrane protein